MEQQTPGSKVKRQELMTSKSTERPVTMKSQRYRWYLQGCLKDVVSPGIIACAIHRTDIG